MRYFELNYYWIHAWLFFTICTYTSYIVKCRIQTYTFIYTALWVVHINRAMHVQFIVCKFILRPFTQTVMNSNRYELNTHKRVFNSKTSPWNTHTSVFNSKTSPWNTHTRVFNSKTSPWNTHTRASLKQTPWHTFLIKKTKALIFSSLVLRLFSIYVFFPVIHKNTIVRDHIVVLFH